MNKADPATKSITSLLFFVFILLNLVIVQNTYSMTVSGHVKKVGNKYQIQLKNHSESFFTLRGKPRSSAVQSLRKITSGDYIVAQGKTNKKKSEVIINSIDLVGLKSLLGKWRTSFSGSYDFKNFEEIDIVDQFFTKKSASKIKPTTFGYSISPSTGNSWSIFIVTDNAVFPGKVLIKGSQLKMVFLDSLNGTIVHKVKLKKIPNE